MSKNAVMPLDDYKNACDNIREKTETTETIKSGELPKKINDVYEAGQKAEYDRFWDAYQKNGTRYGYYYAFAGSGWNDTTFKPKYDIILKGSNLYAFAYCEVTDLAEALNKAGVILDTSQSTTNNMMFAESPTKRIPIIDLRGQTVLNNVFSGCKAETIEKVIVKEENTYSSPFYNCPNLKNIAFEGVIGKNGVSFQQSTGLTYDSCHSIFTHLKDFRQNIVKNYSLPTDTQGFPFAAYNLVQGQKYSGHYQNDAIGGCDFSGVAQYAEVPNVGQRLAVTFELADPMGALYNVFVYNKNGGLCIFDTFSVSLERYITISTITETRTITMPTTVRDNGNATPEDIAEANARGWTIVWS